MTGAAMETPDYPTSPLSASTCTARLRRSLTRGPPISSPLTFRPPTSLCLTLSPATPMRTSGILSPSTPSTNRLRLLPASNRPAGPTVRPAKTLRASPTMHGLDWSPTSRLWKAALLGRGEKPTGDRSCSCLTATALMPPAWQKTSACMI